jgi:hypothetical protein
MLYLMTATNLLTAIALAPVSPVCAGLLVLVAIGCIVTEVVIQFKS